jgi:hypothetical protein
MVDLHKTKSITELLHRLSESGLIDIARETNGGEVRSSRSEDSAFIPQLTMPGTGPRFPWLRKPIQHVKVPGVNPSSTGLSALKAGLFLLNDFFEDSHSCSQSIEGLGANHTGDYWHAILHRREPDYGNSKYWFRHVGRHPIFPDLATVAREQSAQSSAKGKNWSDRLISGGQWDPLAFVDLCEAAEADVELRQWCEVVQFNEMCLLLESTIREAGAG